MSVRRFSALHLVIVVLTCVCAGLAVRVLAQESGSRTSVSSAFTFQGRAAIDGVPVNGACDFRFRLFDMETAGAQSGPTVESLAVFVANGQFSTQLDFGQSAFTGEARFIEIELRCPAGSGAYTLLPARQELTATPYALYALQVPYSGIIGGPPGFGEGWQNVIVVAKSGGQYTSIQAAIDSVSGASEANRFLVWVAPGIYEEHVTIPSYVTVRGAGREFVTIRTTGGSTLAESITVKLESWSALESVRVELIGSAPEARAVQAIGSSGIHEIVINDVSILCGAPGDCTGLYMSTAVLEAEGLEVQVFVSPPAQAADTGTGIRVATNTTLRLSEFDIRVSRSGTGLEAYGIYAFGGTYQIDQGSIFAGSSAAAYGIAHLTTGSGVVRNTEVNSQSTGTSIGVVLVAETTYFFSDSRVIASSTSGDATGVVVSAGGMSLDNIDLLVSAGGTSTGLLYSAPAYPITLDHVNAGRFDLQPDRAVAGANNISAAANVFIIGSRLYGGPSIVAQSATQLFHVSDSLIDGKSGGTFTCVGAHNAAYVALGTSC